MTRQDSAPIHQTDCTGVTNSKLVTTNHGRQMRGSPSIDDSLPVGVSAQTAAITLSGWSGEIRGEIAVKLSLAALPLRTRPDFETSRVLCGLAQNSAHSELTPNFAAQAAANLLLSIKCPPDPQTTSACRRRIA
ncbi:hypothetical protein ACFQHW_11680 [Lapidilactobacillus achengensis]|uniref:Uncharacterized protein n=1 Tax=Lapidilactobacillus achengensis TaxID=2486000 RepID=A0ABW1URD4_9LACO|nr:hypothetical protein [Lapidilactobacillus achengensis]